MRTCIVIFLLVLSLASRAEEPEQVEIGFEVLFMGQETQFPLRFYTEDSEGKQTIKTFRMYPGDTSQFFVYRGPRTLYFFRKFEEMEDGTKRPIPLASVSFPADSERGILLIFPRPNEKLYVRYLPTDKGRFPEPGLMLMNFSQEPLHAKVGDDLIKLDKGKTQFFSYTPDNGRGIPVKLIRLVDEKLRLIYSRNLGNGQPARTIAFARDHVGTDQKLSVVSATFPPSNQRTDEEGNLLESDSVDPKKKEKMPGPPDWLKQYL